MTVEIYKAKAMKHSPFSKPNDLDFLAQKQISFTKSEKNCDIILAHRTIDLIPLALKYGKNKKYLVWTHEPRWDTHFKNKIKLFPGLPVFHIMNIYTGDVCLNNYHVLASKKKYSRLEPLRSIDFSPSTAKKVVALMLYRNNRRKWSLKQGGKELDLCYLRTKIALEGYRLGKVDIYGRGWPQNISLEDSRGKGWRSAKLEILKKYNFNLCFENTNFSYYCTEKIWDSIMGYCLPIYYGKDNKIYEDFPPNSFLDYCEFENSYEMFKYIDKMDEREFIDRLNLCIEVFNCVYEKLNTLPLYENVLLKIVQKIKEIMRS